MIHLIGWLPMKWLKTRCRKIYLLILEYEGIEEVHIKEYEVFDNMNTKKFISENVRYLIT